MDTGVVITDPQLRKINRGLNDGEHAKKIVVLLQSQVDTLEKISALKDSALLGQQKILEIQQDKFKLAMENVEELKQVISKQKKKKTSAVIKGVAIGAAAGLLTGFLITR